MPVVGVRHFSYTKAGILAARAYAKRTGQRIQMHKKSKSRNPKKRKY